MRLAKALREKVMDLRLRDKLIADGKVTKAEVDEFLASIADDESNATDTGTFDVAEAPSEELQ